MKYIKIKLLPKSDLKKEILECSSKYKSNGFVLSVVGDLSRAAFKCPDREEITYLDGPLEIITLK